MSDTQASLPHDSPADRAWTRDDLIAYADRLLAGSRHWASPNFARITPPGTEGGYGTAVDGLEGFARTFLLAGFRIAGARGAGVDGLIADYTRGVIAGVDPDAADRWVRLDEHPQAKVEAASIALILDMTREWIWDRLDAVTQQRVIDYFAPAVGDDSYPQTNWVWFRLVVQTFLRSVGGPWSVGDIAADLARHDSFVRDGGWFSDGDERSYDHYVGWALHLYPVLWSRMQGAAELANGRTASDVAHLDRYLQDAVRLVGGDGSPLIQGRSLIYRFAAAAPFWIGILAEVPSVSLGQLRRAASGIVSHFARHEVPDADDLLTMGWFGPWRRLAQNYSGPASPYWATKGLLGIALPEDHPVWAVEPEPLPVEQGDTLTVVPPAGWIISGTREDGIVRVVNHGTDHAYPDALVGDSPLYARLGYSTATSPLLNGDAWQEPLEQSVALVDDTGRGTHRAAMQLLDVRIADDDGVAIAGSTTRAHWIDPASVQIRHGSGITGDLTIAGQVTTWSIIRGAWEVRLVRVESLEPGAASARLRIGGWAIAGSQVDSSATDSTATASANGRVSTIAALTTGATTGIEIRSEASPLGASAAVPVIEHAIVVEEWIVTAVALTGSEPTSVPAAEIEGDTVDVTWHDGTRTRTNITDPRAAAAAAR
ncbi:DUF2264 domain-containing protein [Microbacterium sp.]|uniref:DUF2264 domain-containing protein n=1 Tax=Microbacterium sp. TaxID=51671 RepID=UPI0027341D81|nr:DUF2264 domain-containing protein [Microbacterium sp.]MDP3953133.1 DUF2264 domain-containing protein [Microbacterium sp.]